MKYNISIKRNGITAILIFWTISLSTILNEVSEKIIIKNPKVKTIILLKEKFILSLDLIINRSVVSINTGI